MLCRAAQGVPGCRTGFRLQRQAPSVCVWKGGEGQGPGKGGRWPRPWHLTLPLAPCLGTSVVGRQDRCSHRVAASPWRMSASRHEANPARTRAGGGCHCRYPSSVLRSVICVNREPRLPGVQHPARRMAKLARGGHPGWRGPPSPLARTCPLHSRPVRRPPPRQPPLSTPPPPCLSSLQALDDRAQCLPAPGTPNSHTHTWMRSPPGAEPSRPQIWLVWAAMPAARADSSRSSHTPK